MQNNKLNYELFFKEFERLENFPMSLELTEIFINLVMAKNVNFAILDEEKPFLFKVIESRLKIYNYTIRDQRLILWLCVLSEVPGVAVMYLEYLRGWCEKNKINEIDFDQFIEDIYPNGFPSKSQIIELSRSVKTKNVIIN